MNALLMARIMVALLGAGLALAGNSLLAQPPTDAQPPGKPDFAAKGKKGPKPDRLLMKDDVFLKLVTTPQVERELELVEDQMQQFRRIGEDFRRKVAELAGGADLRALEPEERKALEQKAKGKEAEWRQWLRQEISKVLLPHQHKRLEQIALQLQGIDALNDPQVVQQLNITQQQQDEIARIRQQEREDRDMAKRAVESLVQGKEAGELRKLQEAELRAETEKRILGVLTADQKRRLNELLGKPFDISPLKGPGPGKPRPKEPPQP